jgi:hypothetical protein
VVAGSRCANGGRDPLAMTNTACLADGHRHLGHHCRVVGRSERRRHRSGDRVRFPAPCIGGESSGSIDGDREPKGRGGWTRARFCCSTAPPSRLLRWIKSKPRSPGSRGDDSGKVDIRPGLFTATASPMLLRRPVGCRCFFRATISRRPTSRACRSCWCNQVRKLKRTDHTPGGRRTRPVLRPPRGAR